MRRLIGAAAAALALACAGSAGAATHVLDFESYDVGHRIGYPMYGSWYPGGVEGSPYTSVLIDARVASDPQGAQGNVAHLGGNFGLKVYFSPHISDEVRYTPFIDTIDVLMPSGGHIVKSGGEVVEIPAGEWFTWDFGYRIGSFTSVKFYGNDGNIYLDNFAVRDFYSAAPEPTTWAMMTLGFGLVGGGLRARRSGGRETA